MSLPENAEKQQVNYETEEYIEYPYERNWFVTFWLWLGIIGSVISLFIIFLAPELDPLQNTLKIIEYRPNLYLGTEVVETLRTLSSVVITTSVICAVGSFIGYMKLLSWRKQGFYIVVAATVIDCGILAICYSLSPLNIIVDYGMFIGIPIAKCVLLWAILQISKEGYSCWQQLY